MTNREDESKMEVDVRPVLKALSDAEEWIGILRGSTGDIALPLWDERDPSDIEERLSVSFAVARAALSALSTPSQGERVAQDTAGRTDVDRIAHLLTGSIAATCCHKTGGYNEDPNCECRELAREIIALGLLSPQPTSTLSPHIEGENDGGGRC